jgi:uncharacterized protein YbjT (DUF2867 family)
MRIFLAGATGVIGTRLVPLLVADGHTVAGMTRSPEKVEQLSALQAIPVVCDVFDAAALTHEVVAFGPDAVIDQLTELPDRLDELSAFSTRNDRMRIEGTGNLLAAAAAAESPQFLSQSIAWRPADRADVVERHERQVLDAGGVVVQYGQLYGPGTFYPDDIPPPPRIQIDDAAKRTVPLLGAPSGVVTLVDADA